MCKPDKPPKGVGKAFVDDLTAKLTTPKHSAKAAARVANNTYIGACSGSRQPRGCEELVKAGVAAATASLGLRTGSFGSIPRIALNDHCGSNGPSELCDCLPAVGLGSPPASVPRDFVLVDNSNQCDDLSIEGPGIVLSSSTSATVRGLVAGTYNYTSTCCATIDWGDVIGGACSGEGCFIGIGTEDVCFPGPSQVVISSGQQYEPPPPPTPPPAIAVPYPPTNVSGNNTGWCVWDPWYGLGSEHSIGWTTDSRNPPGLVEYYEVWYAQGWSPTRYAWSTAGTSTPAAVWGSDAVVRIKACSRDTCSVLSGDTYVAQDTCNSDVAGYYSPKGGGSGSGNGSKLSDDPGTMTNPEFDLGPIHVDPIDVGPTDFDSMDFDVDIGLGGEGGYEEYY